MLHQWKSKHPFTTHNHNNIILDSIAYSDNSHDHLTFQGIGISNKINTVMKEGS